MTTPLPDALPAPDSPPLDYSDQNCPRGKFPVDLMNALQGRLSMWTKVAARKAYLDLFGHPIALGEEHYFRATGPGFDSCDRLALLSMDRMLWLTFGGNTELIKLCGEMAENLHAKGRAQTAQAVSARPEISARESTG